jgi:aspartate racemase
MAPGESIGILGGMGPAATADLFQKIIDNTDARGDAGHIPMVILNNPHIPDRTAAIFNQGPSPLPLLLEGARFLARSGVTRIVIPCITAHHHFDKIAGAVDIPVHHLLLETLESIIEKYPRRTRFGLLATSGTIKTKLFSELFSIRSLDIIVPDSPMQNQVMEAVYGKQGLKQGYVDPARALLMSVTDHLIGRGAEAVIAGCTEIPLALSGPDLSLPLIDPILEVARKLISCCGYPLKDG